MRTTEQIWLIGALAMGACNPDGPREYDDYELAALLGDDARADVAMERLTGSGAESISTLEALLLDDDADISARGRAVLALTQIGGPEADRVLSLIQEDPEADALLQVWAIAARIQMTEDQETFLALSSLISQHPTLERPIRLKLEQMEIRGLDALELYVDLPQLQSALQSALLEIEPTVLVEAMYTSERDGVRREAAAWLATKGLRGEGEAVGAAVNAALDCSEMAEVSKMPWSGGALYVPAIRWEPEPARALVRNLIGWHLYAARLEDAGAIHQIANNLQSVGLRASGFYTYDPHSADRLLQDWARVAGAEDARELARLAGYDSVAQVTERRR